MALLDHPVGDGFAPPWTVKIKGDIPPDRIELVCAPSDPRVWGKGAT